MHRRSTRLAQIQFCIMSDLTKGKQALSIVLSLHDLWSHYSSVHVVERVPQSLWTKPTRVYNRTPCLCEQARDCFLTIFSRVQSYSHHAFEVHSCFHTYPLPLVVMFSWKVSHRNLKAKKMAVPPVGCHSVFHHILTNLKMPHWRPGHNMLVALAQKLATKPAFHIHSQPP